MKSNHKILISLGKKNTKIDSFIFDYQKIKNIQVHIYKYGVEISFYTMANNISGKYLDQNNIKEIIKRSIFVSYLVNRKCLEIDIIRLKKDDSIVFDGVKRIYSLLNSNAIFPQIEYAKLINEAKYENRSSYSWRVITFVNLLIGINKKFYYEKFSYLWMAFNAMYSPISHDGKKKSDVIGMTNIANIFGLEKISSINRENRNKIFSNFNYYGDDEKDLLTLNSLLSKYVGNDERITNINDFYLLEMSYYLRCKYFHGGKMVPFLAFNDDSDIIKIEKCSNLLMNFLIKNLNCDLKHIEGESL